MFSWMEDKKILVTRLPLTPSSLTFKCVSESSGGLWTSETSLSALSMSAASGDRASLVPRAADSLSSCTFSDSCLSSGCSPGEAASAFGLCNGDAAWLALAC